jgi:hypothetical protein
VRHSERRPEVIEGRSRGLPAEATAQAGISASADAIFTPQDQLEIDAVAQQKPLIAILPTIDIAAIIKNICEHPVFQFADAMLQERCKKIVESRVRDVRDANATRAQFERAVEQGGLGVTGRRLADLTQALEAQVDAYQAQVMKDQAQKKESAQQEKRLSQEQKTQLSKREDKLLTKRYVQLTGTSPSQSISPVAPTGARVTSAMSASDALARQEAQIDTQKVRSVIEAAKPLVQPSQPIGNPSMQEVSFEKRLSGPVDELSSMSLMDFRRLSRDPQQAATKVKDTVDLLEEQGYDKKIAAIQAWRSSPLNQLYVGLTKDAVLKGLPMTEILAQHQALDKETLTETELKVLMELNGALRF